MTHTPLHGWKERDRKAEEKRKKAKGQPIQKPPKKKRKKRPRITPEDLRRRNPEVHEGFEEALPSEMHISELRRDSPLGSFSPKAAVMDATNEAMTALSPEEKARGRRHAETAAKLKTKPKKKGGGRIRGMKGGGKVHGAGLARRRRS
jgi:hypothetical protein